MILGHLGHALLFVVAAGIVAYQTTCAAFTTLVVTVGVVSQAEAIIGCLALLASRAEGYARPLMCRFLPPSLVVFIYSAARGPYLWALGKAPVSPPATGSYHKVEAMGLTFRNDLGNAAGLDKDGTMLELQYRLGAGFAVVGTVLSAPHKGNQFVLGTFCPWVPLGNSHAGLNTLGLPSKGVKAAVKNIADFKAKHGPCSKTHFPIGVSIMGHPGVSDPEAKLDGVCYCVKEAAAVADFIEVNESCPNVSGHDTDAKALEQRLQRVMDARNAVNPSLPILVKFGKIPDPDYTVKLLDRLGYTGIVGLNTQTDYEAWEGKLAPSDLRLFRWYTKTYKGGFSGPPILPRSLDVMAKCRDAVKRQGAQLTLIHVGGIEQPDDIPKSREVAVLREWYTGLMHAVATSRVDTIYERMTA
eukprot:Sspe_Gene.42792::Locus_20822_Transcript_2_2_Confidence_0.500_Length_1328::g.42792::m.42792/K00254/DHODH, pyrD; dihydroorotate dehydrogenase